MLIVVALQAGTMTLQHGWRFAIGYLVVACAVLIPSLLYVSRSRARAACVAFWLLGSMFVFPWFGLACSHLALALVVPALSEPLAPWVSPGRTRLIVVAVFLLVGSVAGVLIWWAAWLKFPFRRGAA